MNHNKLSLLAKYDDMCRLTNSLVKSDKEFKDVLIKCEYNRSKWLECKKDLEKSIKKNAQLEAANVDLQQKLTRLRYAYGEEVQRFEAKLKECSNLRSILDSIRECVQEDAKSSKSSINNSKNLDSLLSVLSDDELLKRFSINSKKRLSQDIDEEELNFDKTEDSINVTKVNETFVRNLERNSKRHLNFHSDIQTNRRSSSDSGNPDSNLNSNFNHRNRLNSKSSSPTSCTFSEDYFEQLSNRIISSEDDEILAMADDENDSENIPANKDNFHTPKSISSPTIPVSVTNSRYVNSVKSIRHIKLDLDRLDKRPHSIQLKKVFKPLICVPCGKSITFYSKAVVCVDCRAVAHVHCEKGLNLPCIPHYTPRGLSRNGIHSRMLMIGDFIAPDARPFVPSLLVHCCNEIERRGISEQGIYRKCGSDREVRELKTKFLHSKTGPPNISKTDVHVLCGVVKLFLRDLDDPLITRILWNDFARATDVINSDKTEELLMKAIEQLPDANRDSLSFLILHLQQVAAHSSTNRMAIKSIAKIFGPTAVGYSIVNPPITSIVAENGKQVQIMESLLEIDNSFWQDKLRNPDIYGTPLRGINTPKIIQELHTSNGEIKSPYSCRSGSSSIYVTPRTKPKVARYTPVKRNRLFTDLIY